ILSWCSSRHNADLSEATLITTPGVVSGIGAVINALTDENDGILIMEPVYHPFRRMIEVNKRRTVVSELSLNDGYYTLNMKDIEEKIVNEAVKMVIFCTPANPIGRVWTIQELKQVADVCQKHGVILISDEIHMDFVFPQAKHHMLVTLNPAYRDFVITLISASKTFNLADTHTSQLFVYNQTYVEKIEQIYARLGITRQSGFALEAQAAAYRNGHQYVDDVNAVILENKKIVETILEPTKIKITKSEGLYLLWLDFRAYKKDVNDIMDLLLNKAHVWLINGEVFGKSGTGFFRMNIASDPMLVKEACTRMAAVFNNLI
ncbi:MAG: aminotransferase class I/II-fold pyridoxal phosphate-dependent enzyme, partial [Erysipelothrix sp.]|nr:aminotransferase class I/II-fold pyridoxal phosphate-dependent enzyme [Erysipelothrix sp.]